MRKLIRFSVIVFFIVLTLDQLQAQVRFGPKAGVNFSSMTMKSGGISIDPSNLTGFHAGVISEITLGNNFSLQPAFIYSTKGSSYYVAGFNVEAEIKPDFLEVPVNAVYKIGAGPVNVLLMAGPYFAYGIGGSYTFKSALSTVEEAINFGSGEENDLKPFDVGLNFGAGVELSHFQLAVQYGLGLTNLAPVTDDDTEQKNKVITISLAYLFGVR